MEEFWKALLRGLAGESKEEVPKTFDLLMLVFVLSLVSLLVYSGM